MLSHEHIQYHKATTSVIGLAILTHTTFCIPWIHLGDLGEFQRTVDVQAYHLALLFGQAAEELLDAALLLLGLPIVARRGGCDALLECSQTVSLA